MAKPNIRLNPPSFAPDAIPTPRGWVHPKTGELLVSVKLDMDAFKPKAKTKVVKEAKEEVQDAPKEEPKTKSTRTKRTRKTK